MFRSSPRKRGPRAKELDSRLRGNERRGECAVNIESPVKDGAPVSFALGEDYPELREPVRRICEKYPGAYWRDLEARSAYPTNFVKDLPGGGSLAPLTPGA